MTPLEIIFMLIIWVATGCYICKKRNWYPKNNYDDVPQEVACTGAIIFAPINLAIVLFKLFFIYDWTNKN